MFASRTECNSAKNATLDASAAARTAENEPEEVYLRFPEGNTSIQVPKKPCMEPHGATRTHMQLIFKVRFSPSVGKGGIKKKPHTRIGGKRRKRGLRRENTSFSRCELTIKTAFLV